MRALEETATTTVAGSPQVGTKWSLQVTVLGAPRSTPRCWWTETWGHLQIDPQAAQLLDFLLWHLVSSALGACQWMKAIFDPIKGEAVLSSLVTKLWDVMASWAAPPFAAPAAVPTPPSAPSAIPAPPPALGTGAVPASISGKKKGKKGGVAGSALATDPPIPLPATNKNNGRWQSDVVAWLKAHIDPLTLSTKAAAATDLFEFLREFISMGPTRSLQTFTLAFAFSLPIVSAPGSLLILMPGLFSALKFLKKHECEDASEKIYSSIF
uniref:Uncharacterized protein n=1 Tax=Chromera velia CCMP2878 TaxID=1169474 RepID=A0A0G4H3Z7_9ALVE|eukprot:Cvel_5669.t1-p1 / transcript=Cvel_5669.t1 / gene=Cvel_5669 / organism=Chromera_velia_CCMP2878 / gene_product=hypothetical protein / transcript_product=hypothetical protein / location=Cvel_scaffold267:82398-87719(-) / protein_length=267 / sequence_SO=supercontig / SO=protein_coding / is_pseudo=false